MANGWAARSFAQQIQLVCKPWQPELSRITHCLNHLLPILYSQHIDRYDLYGFGDPFADESAFLHEGDAEDTYRIGKNLSYFFRGDFEQGCEVLLNESTSLLFEEFPHVRLVLSDRVVQIKWVLTVEKLILKYL